eukprot:2194894-Pyramimonas_sp.AAC.1
MRRVTFYEGVIPCGSVDGSHLTERGEAVCACTIGHVAIFKCRCVSDVCGQLAPRGRILGRWVGHRGGRLIAGCFSICNFSLTAKAKLRCSRGRAVLCSAHSTMQSCPVYKTKLACLSYL